MASVFVWPPALVSESSLLMWTWVPDTLPWWLLYNSLLVTSEMAVFPTVDISRDSRNMWIWEERGYCSRQLSIFLAFPGGSMSLETCNLLHSGVAALCAWGPQFHRYTPRENEEMWRHGREIPALGRWRQVGPSGLLPEQWGLRMTVRLRDSSAVNNAGCSSIPSMWMIVYNPLELQAHHTRMSSHTSVPPTWHARRGVLPLWRPLWRFLQTSNQT